MSCQTIYVMLSSFLSEEEKRIVAAHELGHVILHRTQLKMAPMSDNRLYNMINETEYQANLFAADLLIEDQDVAELSKNEDLDYFSFCSSLYATPEPDEKRTGISYATGNQQWIFGEIVIKATSF